MHSSESSRPLQDFLIYHIHFYFLHFNFSPSVQVHIVRGTGVLQQYVDKQQLPKEIDGDFAHCHSDWLAFRLVSRLLPFLYLHKIKIFPPGDDRLTEPRHPESGYKETVQERFRNGCFAEYVEFVV